MMLFKIWIFEFNISVLISFLVGISFGIVLIVLLYFLVVLFSIRKKRHIVKGVDNAISDEEVLELVNQTRDLFKDKKLRKDKSQFSHCMDLSFDMIQNISRRFFPESKYPLYEISVDELLLLSVYISKRLDELLSHRGLKLVRRLKISTIISLTDTKKSIDDHSLMKITKKYKLTSTFKAAKSVINVVNPIYWTKKLVINTTTSFVIGKICLVIISICGEETYKVYSKSVFDEEVDVDFGSNALVNELQEKIEETENQLNVEQTEMGNGVVDFTDVYKSDNDGKVIKLEPEKKDDKFKKFTSFIQEKFSKKNKKE
ncbi:MAG: hypothetical protein ACRC5M_06475 [Anaeroplasmataceae bacterium]